MAIQVSGTTVIDNSRILQNIVGMNGAYNNLQPITSNTTSVIDFNTPLLISTMTANRTFSESNKSAGHTALLVLDRSGSSYTPSWSINIKWPAAEEPIWADHRYWTVTFICVDSSTVRATAVGYNG